jgi:valyl-tRNA synthetase
VQEAGASFEEYDYARALERTESFFWWYCDYYLELVKGRRYDTNAEVAGGVSRALRISLSVFQRLLAPFLPFVCEEVWSWWKPGSVHRAAWPLAQELLVELEGQPPERAATERLALEVSADVLREVRKAKTQARVSMRTPVELVIVHDTQERLAALELGAEDVRLAGAVELLELVEGAELSVEVRLAQGAGE